MRIVRGGVGLVVAWVGCVVVSACSGASAPSDSSGLPTRRQRCEQACSAEGEHPCAATPGGTPCVDQCEQLLGDKSEDCASCYFQFAGMRGTECSCASVETPLGTGDLACEECTSIGNGRTCAVQLVGKCTDGARACEGFHAVALDSAYCAKACGLPVNNVGDRCAQACARPSDQDNPCTGASAEAVESCNAACRAATTDVSPACAQCYFDKSYWLGTTCECNASGRDCELCNVGTNRGGTSKACVDTPCNGTQCVGWQSGDCREECGGLDADGGADAAGTDAGADGGESADAG